MQKEEFNWTDLTVTAGQRVLITTPALHLAGGVTIVLGENGVGKTQLLRTLHATDRLNLRYLPQTNAVFDEDLTVQEILDLVTARIGQDAYQTLVQTFGVQALLSQRLGTLSGGQKQRVWLVYALQQVATGYLLDEPFNALDIAYQAISVKYLKKLGREKPVVVVVHDVNLALMLGQQFWLVRHNSVDVFATLTHAELEKTYHTPLKRLVTELHQERYFIDIDQS